jgi:hypothetical protein
MRHALLVAVLLIGPVVAGCVSAPTVPDDHSASEVESAVDPSSVLWATDRKLLEAAFRKFAASPGTTPNLQFVTVQAYAGHINLFAGGVRFAFVPPGWKLREKDESEIKEITLDEDNFRTDIRIDLLEEKPKTLQGIECHKGKGDTDYEEFRCIRVRRAWVKVTLTVSTYQSTLGELLAHLQKHYGEYQGVCQQVSKLCPVVP